jgi:hypothetical protein
VSRIVPPAASANAADVYGAFTSGPYPDDVMVIPRPLLAAALVAAPGLAGAVTLAETSAAPFGGRWSAPTAVAPGVSRIEGTGAQNVHDFLVLADLAAGAQTLTFTFAAPERVDWSYSAGGQVLWSEDAFRWGWDGATAFAFGLDHGVRSAVATLALGEAFAGGALHLGLYFTHGALAYAIEAPSNAFNAPAAVPLPAAGLLLVVAAAALAALRRRS